MEQPPPSSHLGILLGLPLIAMTLAIVATYLMTDKKPRPAPESVQSEPAPPEPEPEPIRPAPPPRPITPAAPPRAAPPVVAAPPPARTAPPERPDAAAQIEQIKQDPKLREHAQLMVAESARHMMKQRNLEQLRRLRDSTRAGGLETIISPVDLQAIEVGMDCLAHSGGFRARADDFFDDHPSSDFNETLREICQ